MTIARSRRPGLIVLGIAALTAAASAVPRDSGAQAADPALALHARRASAPLITMAQDVVPERNPFANDPDVIAPPPPVSATTLQTPRTGVDVHFGDARARNAATALDGNEPRVTATVTGARPFAIVIDGSGTQIVTVGDVLAGRAIAAIDASGIRRRDDVGAACRARHAAARA